MARVLVIASDEGDVARLLAILRAAGQDVMLAPDGSVGLAMLKRESFDLCYVWLDLPDMEGIDIVRETKRFMIPAPCIMLSGPEDRERAEAALWEGAYDWLQMPPDEAQAKLQLNRALVLVSLMAEARTARSQAVNRFGFPTLTGGSTAIVEVYRKVETASGTEASVLITGEPGVGKGAIARAIHAQSGRSHRMFVSASCSVVPETLLEPELFGIASGPYSHTISVRAGKLDMASGGTILLEDIDRLHPSLQTRLLRAFEDREAMRVGGTRAYPVDVRIIASATADLASEAARGRFNAALYRMISEIRLDVPPIRRRKGDVPVVLEHFMAEHATRLGRSVPKIERDTRDILLRHDWPGNLDELEAFAEHAVLVSHSGTVRPEDLPLNINPSANHSGPGSIVELPEVNLGGSGIVLRDTVREIETRLINEALSRSAGVRTKAARMLGMKRTTLVEKMRALGIKAPAEPEPETGHE